MLRSTLVAALMQRRDNDVEVEVGGSLVPVDRVEYHAVEDRVVIRLDPVGLMHVLAIVPEDGVARVSTWRMRLRAPYAAMIATGDKTLEVRADHHGRRGLAEGHLILFDTDHPAHPSILVHVQNVTRYPTLTQLLDHEDPASIAGAGATRDDVTALLSEIYPEPLSAYLAIEVSLLSPVSQPRPPTAVEAAGIAVITE